MDVVSYTLIPLLYAKRSDVGTVDEFRRLVDDAGPTAYPLVKDPENLVLLQASRGMVANPKERIRSSGATPTIGESHHNGTKSVAHHPVRDWRLAPLYTGEDVP